MNSQELYRDIVLYLKLAKQAEKDIAEFTGTKVGETFQAIWEKRVRRQDENNKFWYFFHGIGFSVEYKDKKIEIAYDYSVQGGFDIFYAGKAWFTIDDNPHVFRTKCSDPRQFKEYLDLLVAQGKLSKLEEDENLYKLV